MGTIKLVTAVPGPRSTEIVERHKKVVSDAYDLNLPVVIAEGHGASFTDVDGNVFLDFATGVGPNLLGHSHPRVVEAVLDQARRFSHTDYAVVPYESFVELGERLVRMTGRTGDKVALFNSGAEAVENAVKLARAATGRTGIITFERAFHGRTLMALTLTSKQKPYKSGFGPFAPEVYRVPFPYPYRSEDPHRAGAEALAALESAFVTHVDPSQVAAVIVEPIQGEGGFVVPPRDFLPGLRSICERHGIVLIADEVQSGCGRTGRFLASEHFGVEADMVILAKALASGYPLSAVVARPELMDVGSGRIGGTYVGNPVACAAANAVLGVLEDEGLMERALEIEKRIGSAWEEAGGEVAEIGEVRGIGAMMAVEFVTDRESKTPNRELVRRILDEAGRRGLVALSAGIDGNVIRHLVPLIISDDDLDEGLDILTSAARSQR
ncbi:MAG TPA: aspartate aminotransferase family protein [Actinomycetota bacterium]|nr:aspartate aminotransferase family protein [Actinomycetota bacterium]